MGGRTFARGGRWSGLAVGARVCRRDDVVLKIIVRTVG